MTRTGLTSSCVATSDAVAYLGAPAPGFGSLATTCMPLSIRRINALLPRLSEHLMTLVPRGECQHHHAKLSRGPRRTISSAFADTNGYIDKPA
jgi:hypothetical protein